MQGADWVAHLHHELRAVARSLLAHERHGHTLSPTALVNEAWLRLFAHRGESWKSSSEFLPAASCAMRRVLIDHARRATAAKRPPLRLRAPLEASSPIVPPSELDHALARLEAHDPQLAVVMQLRAFAGLTNEEAAAQLDLQAHEIKRDFQFAKAWLRKELGLP